MCNMQKELLYVYESDEWEYTGERSINKEGYLNYLAVLQVDIYDQKFILPL